MGAEVEIWQVICGDDVYQATLPELMEWIAEGLVLPGDPVRKGNLNWLEANRVPALHSAFASLEEAAAAAPSPQEASLLNLRHH